MATTSAGPCRRAAVTRHGSRRSRAVSHSTHSRRVSNRSGRSVRGVTRTSPASPYGRPISPIATSRPSATLLLLHDLEDGALAQLGRVGVEDRPQRPRRSSLLADDLAQVGLGHPQLDHRHALPLDFRHVHLLRLVDQRLCEIFHQVFQRPLPLQLLPTTASARYAPAFGANAISFFTVLEGWAPLAIHACAFSRSIVTCGGVLSRVLWPVP